MRTGPALHASIVLLLSATACVGTIDRGPTSSPVDGSPPRSLPTGKGDLGSEPLSEPDAGSSGVADSGSDFGTEKSQDGGSAPSPILAVRHGPSGGQGTIRSKDTVDIVVTGTTASGLEVEFYVEDLEKSDHPTKRLPLSQGDGSLHGTLPPEPNNTIVRYRIVAGDKVLLPKDGGWLSYFVTDVTGKTPTYFLFIAKKDWSQLWTNIKDGRVPLDATGKAFTCKPNPTYDEKVPAVLVFDGQVVDVKARYQGSPYNRRSGPQVKTWPMGAAPAGPTPLAALSWHFEAPKSTPLAGKQNVVLIKRANECSFFTTGVGGQLFEKVGIPSSQVSVARLYVNGTYLHFYSEVEHPDGDMLKRFFGSEYKPGLLFKADGWNGTQGPYTWADGRELAPTCGLTADEVYALNYSPAVPKGKTDATEVMQLVHDLNKARAAGTAAMRAFFAANFDIDRLTSYVALINWLIPWDDFWQNYFLYKKPEDGKWMFIPWDFDLMFGGFSAETNVPAANSSFYIGEVGDRSNRTYEAIKWSSLWKDAFIKSYRSELEDRIKSLATGVLAADKVNALIDQRSATYFVDEAKNSATQAYCDAAPMIARMKKFTNDRNARALAGQFK